MPYREGVDECPGNDGYIVLVQSAYFRFESDTEPGQNFVGGTMACMA